MKAGTDLTSNEVEAANRAEVTARLIRLRYRVYRPEADVDGEDLVLRSREGDLIPVQLKARPTVDQKKYGGDKGIWMLFPDPEADPNLGRDWYLVPHNILYDWMKEKHGHTDSIKVQEGWSQKSIPDDLREFLKQYKLSVRG